jgi:nicotinamide-nucleotide adenylyltransferase
MTIEHQTPNPTETRSGTAGMVARWQPVHLGHAAVLRGLCKRHQRVFIGIGSANVQNARSPFTLAEVTAMLELVLADFNNYQLIPLPDLGDGPRWQEMVLEKFGPLDIFYTANPYVRGLMEAVYPVAQPVSLVPSEERIPINGTSVRLAMARGEDWAPMLPPSVAAVLQESNLVARFREQFGLETLALETIIN